MKKGLLFTALVRLIQQFLFFLSARFRSQAIPQQKLRVSLQGAMQATVVPVRAFRSARPTATLPANACQTQQGDEAWAQRTGTTETTSDTKTDNHHAMQPTTAAPHRVLSVFQKRLTAKRTINHASIQNDCYMKPSQLKLKSLVSVLTIACLLFVSSGFSQVATIWTNPITGTNPGQTSPFTSGDVANANIAVSGIGRTGLSGANNNDAYNASNWGTSSTVTTTKYFSFTITPNTGYRVSLNSFVYTGTVDSKGPSSFAFRTDANSDNFTTNIGSPSAAGATLSLSIANVSSATSFRFYGWNAQNGTGQYSINNFSFTGSVLGSATTALSGFTYVYGSGPATAQNFKINAAGLTTANATVTITGSTNYEVSTTSASTGFGSSATLTASSGSITSGDVWVRLKSGLAVNNYNENITFGGGGVSGLSISCSGSVTTKALTVTGAAASDKTYDGNTTATISNTGTLNGVVGGDNVGVSTSGTFATASVGTNKTVTLALTGTAAGNYSLTQPNITANITSRPISLTANSVTRTYGTALTTTTGSGFSLTAGTYASGESATSVTLTPDAAGASATTAAGASFAVTPSAATSTGGFLASNYNITYVPFNGTVAQAGLTVTASTAAKTYGQTLTNTSSTTGFTPSGLKNSETIGSVTLSYGVAAAATAVVGTYSGQVTPSAATGGTFNPSNYSISYVSGNISVTAAALTVKANDQSKVYGSTLSTTGVPGTTLTITGLQNSDAVSGATLSFSGSPAGNLATASAGSYTITPSLATFSTGSAGNYTISYPPANLTVTKAPLTVTANNKAKTYGTANPTLDVTYSGFVDGQSLATSGVTGSPSLSTTAATTSTIGGYPINVAQGTLASGNYSFTFVNGTLTIGKAPLAVTANNKTRTYGSANPTLDGTLTGVVSGDGITATYTTTAVATSPVGDYSITPALNDPNNKLSNYTVSSTNGTLTISVAALTITASNQTKCQGTTFTFAGTEFTSAGLQNSETIGSVTLTSAGAASGAAGGTYSIVPSAATAGSFTPSNYAITYNNGTFTVNSLPTATISGDATVCRNSSSPSITFTGSGGTAPYTFSYKLNNGSVQPVSTTGTNTTTTVTVPTSTPGSYTYTLVSVADQSCSQSQAGTAVVEVGNTNTWTGNTSTDWSVASNWSCGVKPSNEDAVIPAGTIQPRLSEATTVNNLIVSPGATPLDLYGRTLTISGTVNGSPSLAGSPSSSLILTNNAGTLNFVLGSGVLQNLTLNAGASATLGMPLDITAGSTPGSVTVNSGATLNTNDQLTLKSDANGTAYVAPSSGTISGKVTVERYVPLPTGSTNRRYHLLTSPVMGTSINASWQEGLVFDGTNFKKTIGGAPATPQAGYGTMITGQTLASASAANQQGFDWWSAATTSTASIRSYQSAADPNGASWEGPVTTTTVGAFDSYQAYLLFVRGDRSAYASGNAAATTLRATGTLRQGTQFATLPAQKSHTLLGNPYAAPLDLLAFYNENNSAIDNAFYVWDASLGTATGGYVLLQPATAPYQATDYEAIPAPLNNLPSAENRLLHSGQGFFVMPAENFTTEKTLTFRESHKSTGTPGLNILRTTGTQRGMAAPAKLYVNLSTAATAGKVLLDGVLAQFDASFTGSGVAKAINGSENLAVLNNNSDLIVSSTGLPKAGDVVELDLWNTAAKDYLLELKTANFAGLGLIATLEDKFTNKQTPVALDGSVTPVSFTITSDAASQDPLRFRIVFKTGTVLAGQLAAIKATAVNGGVNVEWKMTTENGIVSYEVQKSTDGNLFEALATKPATGAGQYQQFDSRPAAQTWYRVKITGIAGSISYSTVVTVTLQSGRPTVQLYPNPALGATVQMQLQNVPAGACRAMVYNNAGQLVQQRQWIHPGGNAAEPLNLEALSAGAYQIRIKTASDKETVLQLTKLQ